MKESTKYWLFFGIVTILFFVMGVVSLFDKITTGIATGAFLLFAFDDLILNREAKE